MPKRIQMKRTRGCRKPANAIYVGRPTKWGNPFRSDGSRDAASCVACFRKWLAAAKRADIERPTIEEIRSELRGKDLACWCKTEDPCHADVLLELANS